MPSSYKPPDYGPDSKPLSPMQYALGAGAGGFGGLDQFAIDETFVRRWKADQALSALSEFLGTVGHMPQVAETARRHRETSNARLAELREQALLQQIGQRELAMKQQEAAAKQEQHQGEMEVRLLNALQGWAPHAVPGVAGAPQVQDFAAAARYLARGEGAMPPTVGGWRIDPAARAAETKTAEARADLAGDKERADFDLEQGARRAGAEAGARTAAGIHAEHANLGKLGEIAAAKQPQLGGAGGRPLPNDQFLRRFAQQEAKLGTPERVEFDDPATGAKHVRFERVPAPGDEEKRVAIWKSAATQLLYTAQQRPVELLAGRVVAILESLPPQEQEALGQRFAALALKQKNEAVAAAVREMLASE